MLKDASPYETKVIQIAELNIKPCELCFEKCAPQPFECIIDDDFQKLFKEMTVALGIIFCLPILLLCSIKISSVSRKNKLLRLLHARKTWRREKSIKG